MVAAWAMDDGFWMPLRMIGAIVLGEEALEASYSLAGAAVAGAMLHMALSALYGAVFAALVELVRGLRSSGGVLVAAASLCGLTLLLVNFYVRGWASRPRPRTRKATRGRRRRRLRRWESG
jgi:hypothetical protein